MNDERRPTTRTSATPLLLACLLLSVGCTQRSYIYNGVPYPTRVAAEAAMQLHEQTLVTGVTPDREPLDAGLLFIYPGKAFALTTVVVTGPPDPELIDWVASATVHAWREIGLCIQQSRIVSRFAMLEVGMFAPKADSASVEQMTQAVDAVRQGVLSGYGLAITLSPAMNGWVVWRLRNGQQRTVLVPVRGLLR